MKILFNSFPGLLVSKSISESVYEAVCITLFDEADIKTMVIMPLLVVPSTHVGETLIFLGSTIRYINYGVSLTNGSDMVFKLGNVFTSDPILSLTLLAESMTIQVPSNNPPEESVGVPITLNANAEYPFEGGDGSSFMYVTTNYTRIM